MRRLLGGLLLCAVMVAQAETVYVNDVLRINVREQPGSGGTSVAVLTSGTEMQVLERQSGYLHVRTTAGVEGWVSEGFVTAEVPPRQRLAQLEKERAQLQAEIEQLRGSSSASGDQSAQMAAQLASLQTQNDQLQEENNRLNARLQAVDGTMLWAYAALAMLALFMLGVYVGNQRYKKRVQQRFGGLEI